MLQEERYVLTSKARWKQRERGVAEGNRIVNAQDEKRGAAEGNRIANAQVGQEPNFPGIRLPWEQDDYSQETHLKLLRH